MNKYFNTLTNARGDSLPNYRVQVVTSAGASVTIYSDSSGTRFTDSAGNVVNYATASSSGKVQFYWTAASGQVLQVLDTGGQLVDATADFADNFVLNNLSGSIAQSAVTNLTTDLAAKVATSDLASTASGKGAALVGWISSAASAVARTVKAKLLELPLTPEDFGAVGDGITNDTAAMTAFCAALGEGALKSRLGLMTGTYLTTGGAVVSGSGFRIWGGGTIKIANVTLTAETNTAIQFTSCTDFVVEDIKVDGNRANRTTAEASAQLIRVIGGARGHFRKVWVTGGTTDGFYLRASNVADSSTRPTDFVLEDCIANNCYRNNASFIATLRTKIIRGRYYGATGTAPQAGIGFEPNINDIGGNEDFQVLDADVSDNVGFGIYAGGALANKRGIFRVTGQNNGQGIVNIGDLVDGMEVIARCGPHSSTTVTRGLVDIAIGATNVAVDAEFRDITVPDNGLRSCVYTHSGAVNVTIKRIVYDTISIPALFCRAPGSVISNISGGDCTAPNATVSLDTGAARSTLRGLHLIRSTGQAVDILAPYPVVENAYIEDCDSTVACLRVRTGVTDAVLRNIRVHETSGVITAGQVALRPDLPLKEISGFVATGGYTSTNVVHQTVANYVGTKVSGMSPDPFAGSTAINPASIAAQATTTATVGLALANTGDRVEIQPQADLMGLQLTAYVSAAGTITYRLTNSTSAAIDLASATWTFKLMKD